MPFSLPASNDFARIQPFGSKLALCHRRSDRDRAGVSRDDCIAAVSFLCLRFAARSTRWLNPIAMKITERIMGLLLASVAVQFMINALAELKKHSLAKRAHLR